MMNSKKPVLQRRSTEPPEAVLKIMNSISERQGRNETLCELFRQSEPFQLSLPLAISIQKAAARRKRVKKGK